MPNANDVNNNNEQTKTDTKDGNKKKHLKNIDIKHQSIWESIAKNYEMIQGAQLSNSFIILMALEESNG